CKASNDKGARQSCVPGTKMCAGDKAEQVCNEAGTGWAVTMCMLDESCQGTECKADPKSSCDDVGMCKDNKTAIRCAGMDKGFELVECKGDTYCEGGRCRGPACIVGSF